MGARRVVVPHKFRTSLLDAPRVAGSCFLFLAFIFLQGDHLLRILLAHFNGFPCTMQEAVKMQECFIVANVVNPLLAVGKLLKNGWEIVKKDDGLMLSDGMSDIPVHYHKNSLATYAYLQAGKR